MRLILAAGVIGVAVAAAASPATQESARAKQAYARAIQLEADGNHPAALSLLWEAAGLAPRDPEIQNRLGEALERIGALDGAIDAYRHAIEAKPSFRKAANNLILVLAKAGRSGEAVERARALVAEAPDDADRHFTLGLALSEHDVDAAIRSFTRALELSPQHSLARYNLALVLRRVDRLGDALRELDRVLAIERRPQALYQQGLIYWHMGDLQRAEASMREAIAGEPDYADAHHALGSLLKTRREWAAAAASLRKAIAVRPDLFSARYALAQVLTALGDERGSRAAIEEAERLRRRTELEREALTWTTVGIQRVDQADVNGAADAFRKAIASFEPYAPAHYQLGLVLRRLGQAEAARAAFTRAQQLNPSLVPPANR